MGSGKAGRTHLIAAGQRAAGLKAPRELQQLDLSNETNEPLAQLNFDREPLASSKQGNLPPGPGKTEIEQLCGGQVKLERSMTIQELATGRLSPVWRRIQSLLCWAGLSLALTFQSRAALQFDVFVGYDGLVREAAWFPVACEVYNDGPSFNAVFELSAGNLGTDQLRRVPLELPTNTRKRFVIPVFASGGRYYQWNARLLDDRGKVRAEHQGLQPKFVAWEGKILGALARSFAGVPTLPDVRQNRPELKPQVARLQVEQFPDNPIAFEGLDALYLNSEKALSLKVNQIAALLAWVHEGGRLIVGIEQLGDVNSTPWLQQLLPCEMSDMANVAVDEDLQQWVQQDAESESARISRPKPPARGRRLPVIPQGGTDNLFPDPNFVDAQMPVALAKVREGEVLLAAQNKPLIVEAPRGRGRVTLLTFSPEREPFRSWKNKPWFWAKLMQVPVSWFTAPDLAAYGGWSLDGVFGALIDSNQVRKLPVEWLLLLLVVYLIVIGPFDQYWLKKINRQMLTWITFPTYVVLFSLLIYFIGYKLRAGETEWNELQIVDVLPSGQRAAFRGRTFASIYSSSNAKYPLAFSPAAGDGAEQSYACLRGELLDLASGGQEGSRANVEQHGNVFRAEIFVPVWTSLLYVNDWFEPGNLPLKASFTNQQGQAQIVVENLLDRPLTDGRVAVRGFVYDFGTLQPHERKSVLLDPAAGVPLQSFVLQHGNEFQSAVSSRRNALGDASKGRLENLPLTATVASFAAQLPKPDIQRSFVAPPGMDLTTLVERGDAVVFAWDANQAYARPINGFSPPRLKRNTLLRLAVPAVAQPGM